MQISMRFRGANECRDHASRGAGRPSPRAALGLDDGGQPAPDTASPARRPTRPARMAAAPPPTGEPLEGFAAVFGSLSQFDVPGHAPSLISISARLAAAPPEQALRARWAAERLVAPHAFLRARIALVDGRLALLPVPRPDLDHHVRYVRARAGRPWRMADVRAHARAMALARLARERPPWRVEVFDRLEGGGALLLFVCDHALCDGVGMLAALCSACDALGAVQAPPQPPQPARPEAPVGPESTAPAVGASGRAATSVRCAPRARRARNPLALPPRAPPAAPRSLAEATPLPLSALSALRAAVPGATVTDALWALTAEAVSACLHHAGATRVRTVRTVAPKSVRPAHDQGPGCGGVHVVNLTMALPLGAGAAGPRAPARAREADAAHAAARLRAAKSAFESAKASRVPGLELAAVRRYGAAMLGGEKGARRFWRVGAATCARAPRRAAARGLGGPRRARAGCQRSARIPSPVCLWLWRRLRPLAACPPSRSRACAAPPSGSACVGSPSSPSRCPSSPRPRRSTCAPSPTRGSSG